jgi:hypothetical protein
LEPQKEFIIILFFLMYPRFGAEEASNLGMPTGADQKKLQ